MTEHGRVRVEPTAKRVRVMLGGVVVADTTAALMVWEVPYFPTYYFPEGDVRVDLLAETGETESTPSRGEAAVYTVRVEGAEGAAYGYRNSRLQDLDGHFAFVWKTMDHWFEEDEEVYVHARDPNTRIDILPSSRRIRVEIDGVTVADTTHARFLYETGLPVRYYIPKVDVRMDLLVGTDHVTSCPYKGSARYWSVDVNESRRENFAWAYDSPLAESEKVSGLISFYNERVDIYLDEVLQERPQSIFS
jgi:uncharacterized protein (DUF427 family)